MHQVRSRGVTLIEVIIVVALVAVMMTGLVMGMGAVTNARVRAAATMIASGVQVAFSRSASTSKSMRLVFDLDQHTVMLEESDRPMLVRRDDETGTAGAEAATEQERKAKEEAERILEGPVAPRPLFRPVKAMGFEDDKGGASGRSLGSGVVFKRVEVEHAEEPQTSGRAYLYFWPGGMTERASIQIGRAGSTGDESVLSVLVSPLTGKVKVVGGAEPMEQAREDNEREDQGY